MFTEKKQANDAYHLLLSLFSIFMGSVVCHPLPLFCKPLLGIISFDFLFDSFTLTLPLLFFLVLFAFFLTPLTINNL